MGKTYRSFEKHESYYEHDHALEYRNKKLKKNQIKKFVTTHKDRKIDQLDKLDQISED